MRCSGCGRSLSAHMKFCHQCGTPVPGTASSGSPSKLHIDDLAANCAQCGREARHGDLQRCRVCHDRCCVTCVAACVECQGVACPRDVRECAYCRKAGCADCFEHCESCHVRALCKNHAAYCSDCGYPACRQCMKPCKKCGDSVCELCVKEGHGAAS